MQLKHLTGPTLSAYWLRSCQRGESIGTVEIDKPTRCSSRACFACTVALWLQWLQYRLHISEKAFAHSEFATCPRFQSFGTSHQPDSEEVSRAGPFGGNIVETLRPPFAWFVARHRMAGLCTLTMSLSFLCVDQKGVLMLVRDFTTRRSPHPLIPWRNPKLPPVQQLQRLVRHALLGSPQCI